MYLIVPRIGEKIPLTESCAPLVSSEDLTATASLHDAAYYGNIKVTELLLKSGDSLSVSIPVNSQQTPLHLATAFGQTAIVKILLRAGASPHAVNEGLETPCMMAASDNHLNSLKALVEAGADLALRCVYHHTLMHRTVVNQYWHRSGANKSYAVALYIMRKTT